MVIAGVVLVVIGALLSFVVITGVLPSTAVPANEALVITPKSLGLPAPLTIQWSGGSSATSVQLYDCGTTTPSSGATGACASSAMLSGSGGSGTFNFMVSAGHVYEVIPTTSVNVTANGAIPLIGIPLFFIGIIVLIIGAVRKKKQKPSAAPPQAWQGAPGQAPPQAGAPGYQQPPPQR